MLVLVLTSADDSVTRAVCYDIDAAVVFDGLLDYIFHGLTCADVAEEAMAVRVPALHRCESILVDSTNGDYQVALGGGIAYKGAAHVARSAKDLWMSDMEIEIYIGSCNILHMCIKSAE
jgi:hypothetical protein